MSLPKEAFEHLPVYTSDDELPVCLDGDRLVFVTDCIVQLPWKGFSGHLVELEGNSWDGATIPWFAWSVIGHPLKKEFRWASYWHDRFCEQSEVVEDRTVADAVFLKLLREAGVVKWRRLAMWLAVRFYGVFVWRLRRVRNVSSENDEVL